MLSSSMRLLDPRSLEDSATVANRSMNRERRLRGANGYARELGFDVVDFLVDRAEEQLEVRWLDLCCGSARALFEAKALLAEVGLHERAVVEGVDLVRAFHRGPRRHRPSLHVASLHDWAPTLKYDLITCVHGLHYVGDKLGLLARAGRWLTDDARFVAHLDLANIALEGASARRRVPAWLRQAGAEYRARSRRVVIPGCRALQFPVEFLGSDDRAGPNYTGQPAVTSHYRVVGE